MSSRLAVLAAVLALGATAVSGCGVAGTNFRPGVAAEVDGTTITTSEVKDAAPGMCEYFRDVSSNPIAGRPTSALRGDVVEVLVQQAAMKQLLDERGLDVPPDYNAAVSQIAAQTADFPASQREPYQTVVGAIAYVSYGATALADDSGTEVAPPTSPQQRDPRIPVGLAELATWLDQNDVTINPVFGVTTKGIDPASTDEVFGLLNFPTVENDTSVAVADESATPSDPASAEAGGDANLPANQTCG